MDSLTQAVLGASVAGACAPAGHRRKAMLVGAGLGTLPDLDVLIDFGDAVDNFTKHRGFSHSLFVLPPVGLLLWAVLRRFWEPVRSSPGRWLAAILLTLVTHVLLDAHTAYGTQLWWPLEPSPTSWSTLFIIDPLYTLPLLVTLIMTTLRPAQRKALVTGLALSSVYIAWSWGAKLAFEDRVVTQLAAQGISADKMFSTPSPFNTLLWRAVVMTPDGYIEAHYSFVADDRVTVVEMPFDTTLLETAGTIDAARRLQWFANGFVSASVIDDELVVTDLRMGQSPTYVFSHAVANASNPHWQTIETRQIPVDIEARQLGSVWDALWSGSEAAFVPD